LITLSIVLSPLLKIRAMLSPVAAEPPLVSRLTN
jgi:hypothetical protein